VRRPGTAVRALLVVAVVSSALLITAGAAPGVAAAKGLRLTAAERTVLVLVNQARTDHGLKPVKARTSLVRAARSHSRDMLKHQFFSHRSHNGESFSARIRRLGYALKGWRYWRAGECVGYVSGLLATPEAMVDMWLQSSAHRAIILNPRWRDVGVGCALGAFKGTDGVRLFTLDFGRRRH
jgi:uncharacterized protein YkwD